MVEGRRDFLYYFSNGKFVEKKDENLEDIVRFIVLNAALLAGSLLLFIFGVIVLVSGNTTQSIIDFFLAGICITGVILLRTKVPYIVAASIPICSFGILCTFLVYSGELNGFASLWMFAFPVVAIFLIGLWPGIYLSLLLFAIIAAEIFIEGIARFHYGPQIGARFCMVYILILILTVVYEGVRITKDNWGKRLTLALQGERDVMATMKDNLKTGIFLMNEDFIIQPQYSKALEHVLDYHNLAGQTFPVLLGSSLKSKEIETLTDYFSMVYNRSFDQKTLDEINPLAELNYTSMETDAVKILRCTFAPVYHGTEGYFILGTIEDITAEKELERQLAAEADKRQEEMHSLFEIIQVEPRVFEDFLEDTDDEFKRINAILKNTDISSQEAVIEIYQAVHAIKSNAVILGLQTFGNKVHDLESKIKIYREQESISFDDLLHLAVEIELIMRERDKFEATLNKIHSFKTGGSVHQDEYVLLASLAKAVDRVSADLNKKVNFTSEGVDSRALEIGPRRIIKEILTQLVRNAVYHGIEYPAERKAAGKDESGNIRLSIKIEEDKIHISLSDDGRGLNLDRIREKAKKLKLLDDKYTLDKSRLLQMIFAPGFSTAEDEGMHAGRGIGLNLVRERIKELKGNIKLYTDSGKGTFFHIYLPLEQRLVERRAS
jgi:two-component system chemotaxis sensor kinase CheA